MTRFSIHDKDRTLAILAASDYSGVPGDVVADLLTDYDWPNAAEHQQWINEAPAAEVVSWLEDLCRDDPEGVVAGFQQALEDRFGAGWRDRVDAEDRRDSPSAL